MTGHFSISYDKIRPLLAKAGQPEEPPYVKAIGDELEKIWGLYNAWDYKIPNNQVVYLYPVAHGWDYLAGPARGDTIRPEVAGEAAKTGTMSIGCTLPNGNLVPIHEMKRTLAHEYFHRIQMQYYKLVGPAKFMREGTANLMEILVYPELAEETIKASGNMTPVKFDSVPLVDQGDEAMSFFLYLTQRYGRDIIRKILVEYSGMTATARSAIESAVKESGGNLESIESLFSDFSDDCFTSNPPKHALYPVLRINRRQTPLFRNHFFKDYQSSVLTVEDMEPLTAKYFLCESPKRVKARVRLTSSQAGIVVRLYTVKERETSYTCMLGKGGKTETDESIYCGSEIKIGLLVTNRGSGTAGAVIEFSLEEVKMGFLKGDTETIDARFIPGSPQTKVEEAYGGTPDKPARNMQVNSEVKNASGVDSLTLWLEEFQTSANAEDDLAKHMASDKEDIRRQNVDAERKKTAQFAYQCQYTDRSRFVDNVESTSNRTCVRSRDGKVHDKESVYDGLRIYRDRYMIRIYWTKKNTEEDLGPRADEMFKKARELIDKRFPTQ